jgi:hypothetical protein
MKIEKPPQLQFPFVLKVVGNLGDEVSVVEDNLETEGSFCFE